MLALGQADWLERFGDGKKRPPHEIEAQRQKNELTRSGATVMRALAPYETELRAWLRAKLQERTSASQEAA
jgi:hypothetical protein